MDCTRHVVDKERLIRVDRGDAVHVLDRIVGHGRDQVPSGLSVIRVYFRGVAEQIRLPLVRAAADKAVEIVEDRVLGPEHGKFCIVLLNSQCEEVPMNTESLKL